MNELSAGLAQPPSCAWHNIDSCHNFSGVSTLHGSLQSMWPASGKNHTVLCVIHPDSDTLVRSQGTRWVHSHSCAWDSPFHAVSSTHLLTAASCPHSSDHMPEWKCPPALAPLCFHASRSSRSSPHCALWRQEQRGGMAGMPSGWHAGSRDLSCTQAQRGPTPHSKIHTGHSCSCHLETIRVAASINPSACGGLSGIQVQFSIQAQANTAGNIFSFEGPGRNRKPLLYLIVSSQWLQVFSSMFKAVSVLLNSSLEARKEKGPPCLET